MKSSFKQNKRIKGVTIPFTLSWYDLRKIRSIQYTAMCEVAKDFEDLLERTVEGTDEPI